MDKYQEEFLKSKLEALSKIQPEILDLRLRLLYIGGDQLVAPNTADPDLNALLQHGSMQSGTPVFEEAEENGCHWNVAALWRQGSLLAIGTGYALSDDGLWRQHSWGRRESCIVETTEVRTSYFGLCLMAAEADMFSSQYLD